MCHVGSEWKEASALSFLISLHLLRALGKGQTAAVGTIFQDGCQNSPSFHSKPYAYIFLIVVDAIDGRTERLILCVLCQALYIGLLKDLD